MRQQLATDSLGTSGLGLKLTYVFGHPSLDTLNQGMDIDEY